MEHQITGQQGNRQMMLDHTTLNVTLKEVAFKKEAALKAALERILKFNRVEGPVEHAGNPDTGTAYYTIDLTPEQIDHILDILFALEASYVDEDGAATPTGSFYASLVDKWRTL